MVGVYVTEGRKQFYSLNWEPVLGGGREGPCLGVTGFKKRSPNRESKETVVTSRHVP